MNIKKAIYLVAFTLLGMLTSFLVHAMAEIWYIGRLVADFKTYSLGLSWNQWVMIHHIGAVVLFIAGLVAGYRQGRFWWRIIYVDQKLRSIFPRLKLRDTF